MPRGIYPRKNRDTESKSHPKDVIMYLFHQMSKKELTDILMLGIMMLSEKG